MDDAKFQAASKYAADLLERKLIPALAYHNVSHTLDVVRFCNTLAEMEGVDEESRQLLLVAAYFHDTGLTGITNTDLEAFNAARSIHEERAVEIAREILPAYGFEPNEMDLITSLIMATKWDHAPENLLEQIISDADISSIGRETDYFMITSDALRAELSAFGIENAEREWFENQKEFVGTYKYHTASARRLFDAQRHLNVTAIQARLDSP
jgi:HD superfamily phosphodiesterase